MRGNILFCSLSLRVCTFLDGLRYATIFYSRKQEKRLNTVLIFGISTITHVRTAMASSEVAGTLHIVGESPIRIQ